MTAFSVLDLAPVPEGQRPGDALANSLSLAQHAEALGYNRYWIAEHHNMPGIASSATAVVLAHLGAGTKKIRLGAGGVMLPNHAPLIIAEQFGTLAELYPGRIELGLGRAPGTDQRTVRALRRAPDRADSFPQDVIELQAYLEPVEPGQSVQAVPGEGTQVPLWILGSSLFGARLAAALGLPYAFASHFAPAALNDALRIYREEFKPSKQLVEPYTIACVNVICADTDREASHLFTSIQQQFANLCRGELRKLPPPVDDIEGYWSPFEKAQASGMLARSFVGNPDTVQTGLGEFIEETQVNEVMAAAAIYNHTARLHSYELLAHIAKTTA